MHRVFRRQDILSNVVKFIPSDSPAYGVIASANKASHTEYQKLANKAKENRDDRLFVKLRDYIETDLVGKQGFEKTDDDGYNDLSDDSYYMLLVHSTNRTLVYLLRTGRSVQVSAENFFWDDFTVSTAAEWDVYSPRMSIPVDQSSDYDGMDEG